MLPSRRELGHDFVAPSLKGATICVSASLSESEAAWRTATSSSHCSIFQTYEWLSIWRDTIGATEGAQEHLVTVTGRDGQFLIGLAMAIHRTSGIRILQFLGGDMTDYNLAVSNPEFANSVAAADMDGLWEEIIRLLPPVDVVWLRRMPEALDGVCNPLTTLPHVGISTHAHQTALPREFKAYLKSRDPDLIKNTAYRGRRLGKEGVVDVVMPTDPKERQDLTQFIVDSKSRWQQAMKLTNTFARPDYQQFYERISAANFSEGSIEVAALTVNGVPVSGMWSATFRARYAVIIMAYDKSWSRFAVGRILTERMIESCIARGEVGIFDFTIGDETYKEDWTDQAIDIYEHLSHRTVRGRAFTALRQAGSAVKPLLAPGRYRIC